MTDKPQFTTRAVRAGLETDDVTGAVVPPIHLSSTFAFKGYGEKRTYDYSRSGNPTRDLLSNALADLEGGVGGVITGTGMGAITLVGHLLPQGARIVAPHDCYGGTFRLFTAWNRRNELKVDFVRFAAFVVESRLLLVAALPCEAARGRASQVTLQPKSLIDLVTQLFGHFSSNANVGDFLKGDLFAAKLAEHLQ